LRIKALSERRLIAKHWPNSGNAGCPRAQPHVKMLQKIEALTTRTEEPAQKMKDPTMEWKKVLFQE
jgi:hypothetical protein